VSERTPTPEQAAAIEATRLDVLLEAGAGTGKTGVMVDRYCRLACDEGIDPDAILAFTFTDKAATELRRRIRAELERRARAGEERARALLPGIGGAWVMTIHGFCSRLLAGHPVAAGIDPGFRVLDTPEAERASRETFEEALEEFLADGGAEREETVAAYEVDGLRSIVTGIHAELRSRGIARPRLPAPPQPDVAEALRLAAEAAATTLEELKPTNSSRELVERALTVLDPTGETAPSLEELATLRTSSKAKAMGAYREAIDAAVARVAEAGEGGEAYDHLTELLALYSASFEAAKSRRAAIDFEDLQILAAELLERVAGIGEDYRGRFKHLMVDEFQDTNQLQLRLIEALRGPGSELMVVGDEFQSIYGFRHADLEVFREQRRLMEEGPGAATMSLSGNFRSRPEVVGAVNALGTRLLGESFRPLRVGAEPTAPPSGDGAAVELLLTARDGWDEEGIDLMPTVDGRTPLNCLAEARFVAERLRRLADSGVPRGEMVVLLRAFTHLDAYEDSLERAGLRPYVVGGRGYWSQQQVADVCALLATIANPLDDRALFGALASPACGLTPDTLWLLRAAAGKRRRVWPAVERAGGLREADLAEPERLAQIPASETALLRRFAAAVASLRERSAVLSLAKLVEAAVTETGYDLAVLMRPQGEARFANVRKLMRLAAEFESREGRDLRGFLDFLAARAEGGAEPQAATAVEGHDGVRIMTIHNAKGLEFDVVAVPDLSRSLLAGSRSPLLALGREAEEPRIGMQLRRLGAPAINLFSYGELCEEGNARDAEEGLRLFHVAATRARERLILSGVVKPEPNKETKAGTPIVERIVDAFGIDRESDSAPAVPAPQPRAGLDAEFPPSEIAVHVSLPSVERAAELTTTARRAGEAPSLGEGPAPLARPSFPTPTRFLSYTAISALLESPDRPIEASGDGSGEDRTAHGIAVHSLLEWSQANDWHEPPPELVRRFALAAGLDPDAEESETLKATRAWLGCAFFAERVRPAERSRAEVPFLLSLPGVVLRGSIDLLVETAGEPVRIVDYKTDRLGATAPAAQVQRYETQRDLYALAVSEARGVDEVEVAYVFLERPEEPVVKTLDRAAIEVGRERLEAKIDRLGRLTEPVIPPGPAPASPPARPASAP
jgi:ATP-dependent exoDNAse (exonuclease V) beta subunit